MRISAYANALTCSYQRLVATATDAIWKTAQAIPNLCHMNHGVVLPSTTWETRYKKSN